MEKQKVINCDYKNKISVIFMIEYLLIIIIGAIILWFYTLDQKTKNIQNFTDMETLKYPKLFYINLKHRKDRQKNISKQLKKINYPSKQIVRVNAIKKKEGRVGCALSHIHTLDLIEKKGLDIAIVLEDDFEWKLSPEKVIQTLKKVLDDPKWSICLLACNGKTKKINDYKSSVISCQTTSGYIIRKKYVKILKKFWISTMNGDKITNDIDQTWKILQQKDPKQWIITNPILGRQIASYSDILRRNVEYRV